MRKYFCGILVYFLSAGVADGQEVATHVEKNFSVDVPIGWSREVSRTGTGPQQRLIFSGGAALWREAPGTERPYLGAVRSVRPASSPAAAQPVARAGPVASARAAPWILADLQKEAKALSPSDIPALRTRASGGDARSQFLLGLAYEYGYGGLSKDPEQALRWHKQAAEQAIGLAQAWVGDFYYGGIGAATNYAEALRWYRRSSDNGYHYAGRMTGYIYLAGQGIARDYSEARRWFQAAANGGDETARKIMADLERNCSTQFCVDLQTLLVFGREEGFKALSGGEKEKAPSTGWRGKLLVDGATRCKVDDSMRYVYTCYFFSPDGRSVTPTEARGRLKKLVQDVLAAVPSGWRHDSREGMGSLQFRIGPSLPPSGTQALVEVSADWGQVRLGDRWESIADVSLEVSSRIR